MKQKDYDAHSKKQPREKNDTTGLSKEIDSIDKKEIIIFSPNQKQLDKIPEIKEKIIFPQLDLKLVISYLELEL